MQLEETEAAIVNGGWVSNTQRHLMVIQEKLNKEFFTQEYMGTFAVNPPRALLTPEQLELKAIEDQITGRVAGLPSGELVKMRSDGEASRRDMSGEVQEKARLFKLTTGKSPSWKEIQQWIGAKR